MKNLTLTTFNESEISKERSDFHRRFPSSRRGKYKLAVVDASWSCIKNYLLPPTHARAVGEQTFCTKPHSAPLNLYPVRTGRSICQPFFQGDIDFWSKSIAPFPTPAAMEKNIPPSSYILEEEWREESWLSLYHRFPPNFPWFFPSPNCAFV